MAFVLDFLNSSKKVKKVQCPEQGFEVFLIQPDLLKPERSGSMTGTNVALSQTPEYRLNILFYTCQEVQK